jgi:VanZ family protein
MRVSPSLTDQIELRYSLLTLAAVAVIYVLSSMPDLSAERDPLLQLSWNLAHIPAFGTLAFLMLKAIPGTERASWERCVAALLGSAAYAVADEWHQSFVPGRYASVGDFLLDLAGIAGTLLIVRLTGFGMRDADRTSPQRMTRA